MNNADRDEQRDAHLVAALRHAPDHDVAPSAKLTAAILGHAERALRPPAVGGPSRWRAAWVRLWQPAPMAAFGTIAMTTLVGVMWIGQELPEATPALRPAPVAAAGESAASAPTVPAAEAPPPATAARESLPPVPRVAEPKLPPPTARPRTAAAAPPATPPPAAAAGQQSPLEAEARRDGAAQQPMQAAAQPPSPAAQAPRNALSKSMADAAPAPARARSETAARDLGAAAPTSISAPASPLAPAGAEIDAAVEGDAARVRWRVAGERQVAHGAAQRDWWMSLARTTQGRWQPVAPTPASAAEADSVVLLIDGAPRGALVFEPQALVWRDASGAVWRAALAAPTLREWQQALTRW